MNTENQQLSGTAISLDKAKKGTKRWRKFLEDQSGDYNFKTINKGAFIPFEDIDKLKSLYEKDKKIIGVRAYFALEQNNEKDKTPLHHVKLFLVPVEANGKKGRDILEIFRPESLGDTESTIYDFTRPCPDYCDEDSELF